MHLKDQGSVLPHNLPMVEAGALRENIEPSTILQICRAEPQLVVVDAGKKWPTNVAEIHECAFRDEIHDRRATVVGGRNGSNCWLFATVVSAEPV